jgi:hypothetical protein
MITYTRKDQYPDEDLYVAGASAGARRLAGVGT